jgi:hypothetical protein
VVYAPQEAVSTTVSLSVLGQLVAAPGEERTAAQTRLAKVTEATAEPWISWLLDPSLLSVQGQAQAHSELVQAIQQAVAAGKAVYGLPYQDIDQAALAGQIGGPEALTVSKTLSQNAAAEALGQTASSELIWDLAAVLQPIDQQIASFIGSAGSRAVVLEAGQAASALSQLNLPAAVLKGQTGPALVVTDSELTELLAGPCTALDLNRILALTAFAAWQAQVTGTAASIVIVLPRTWEPIDGEIASLEALKSAVWVEPSELNGLLDNPVSAAVEWNYPLSWPGPDRTSLAKLLDQIARAAAFASLTPDPDAYLARVTPPLLAPLSNSIEAGAARDAAGREAVRQTASEVPPVSVVVGSDVNLISDDGRIPVVVENTSNEPIAGLVISLVPQTNAVRAEEKVVLDLQPGESATARLPVHALANGLYEVKVELLDAKNRPVAEGATLTMRVRAEWEDVGTAIAAGALGIVLVVGIVSTARKRRRLRTAGKQPEAETFDVTTVEAEALDAGTSEAAASGSTVPDATPPGSTVPDSTPRDAAAGRNG